MLTTFLVIELAFAATLGISYYFYKQDEGDDDDFFE